jgi:glutathione S-transferase
MEDAMSQELVFYTNPMSRGRVVRWMLEEIGQPYRTEVMQYDALKSPAYLAINPMGKVPTIRHGETVVTECAAICAYLADVFPEAGLAPAPADRAAYYRWLFFTAGPFEAAITDQRLGVQVTADQQRMVGYGCFDTAVDMLEAAVSGSDYVAGDRFSAADVYVGSQIGFGLQFGGIERRPAFERYWDRVGSRPAAVRAAQIDDALLPPQPAA